MEEKRAHGEFSKIIIFVNAHPITHLVLYECFY